MLLSPLTKRTGDYLCRSCPKKRGLNGVSSSAATGGGSIIPCAGNAAMTASSLTALSSVNAPSMRTSKKHIEKVRILKKKPPVRGDKQGGNTFPLPGATDSVFGELSLKRTLVHWARLTVIPAVGCARFFCVTGAIRYIGQKSIAKRCCFQGYYRLWAAIDRAAKVYYYPAQGCGYTAKRCCNRPSYMP